MKLPGLAFRKRQWQSDRPAGPCPGGVFGGATGTTSTSAQIAARPLDPSIRAPSSHTPRPASCPAFANFELVSPTARPTTGVQDISPLLVRTGTRVSTAAQHRVCSCVGANPRPGPRPRYPRRRHRVAEDTAAHLASCVVRPGRSRQQDEPGRERRATSASLFTTEHDETNEPTKNGERASEEQGASLGRGFRGC